MNKHKLDPLSLAFGTLFLVIACFWLIARTTEMTVSAGWILAAALILIGSAGVYSAVRPRRN